MYWCITLFDYCLCPKDKTCSGQIQVRAMRRQSVLIPNPGFFTNENIFLSHSMTVFVLCA